jgi:hypothetical protein
MVNIFSKNASPLLRDDLYLGEYHIEMDSKKTLPSRLRGRPPNCQAEGLAMGAFSDLEYSIDEFTGKGEAFHWGLTINIICKMLRPYNKIIYIWGNTVSRWAYRTPCSIRCVVDLPDGNRRV